MFKNYLTVTFRNFSKNILYVLINVTGLGLALGVCIVAYMNNKYDWDFDKFHENRDEIYRIELTREVDGQIQAYGISPLSLAPLLKQNLGDMGEVIRITSTGVPVKKGIHVFNKRVAFCDSAFADVFTLEMKAGSKYGFHDKNTIIISEELKDIYFGDEDAIGEIISLTNQEEEFAFIVGGVFKSLPLNSSFRFHAVVLLDNYLEVRQIDEFDWMTWIGGTFIHLPDPSKVPVVEDLLSQYVQVQNDAREDFQVDSFYLYPFNDMAHHGWDIWSHWFRASFHPAAVTAPPMMAIFILLLACFNFMNTAISFSSKRLKEIGIRKVSGGSRRQIIMQFMGENLILSFMAILIGVFVGRYLVSAYSSMWVYLDISLSFKEYPELWWVLGVMLIITSILAGAYPSFYISRFNPVFIFQDKLKIGGRNILSKILLTLQFMISIMALASGFIFTENARFQDNIYLGYDKDNIIAVPINIASHFVAFRDAVSAYPMIERIGESEEHVGWGNFSRSLEYQGHKKEVRALDIGDGYFHTMGFKLLEGREFPPDLKGNDTEKSIIVNQKFVEEFGLEEPVGEKIMMNDTVTLYIVGVMENIYLYGFWAKIDPMFFRRGVDSRMRTLAIRSSAENLEQVNDYLEEVWQDLIPNNPYGGMFQDDLMDEARDINKNIKVINIFLALIATILSTIGLYTLVSLSIIRRTKEIGIRKVNGAPIPRLIGILSKEYIIILLIACLAGNISGFYLSKMLIDSIWEVYSDISTTNFILPVILIFVIATASIGWKVYSAAKRNPAESLRYE